MTGKAFKLLFRVEEDHGDGFFLTVFGNKYDELEYNRHFTSTKPREVIEMEINHLINEYINDKSHSEEE